MPLNTPSSATEVADRSVNDVFLALQEFGAKPSLKNSWLNALIVAYSNRVFDFYFALDQAALEALPDTAVDNLDRWGAIYKVVKTTGKVSIGNVIAAGEVASTIPVDEVLTSGDGFEYVTTLEVSITTKSLSVDSVTRSGTTATLTTDDAHLLSNNVKVTITGAVETDYNVVDAVITVISTTAFTYEVEGSPSTPATGTILAGHDTAVLPVESVAFTEDTNAVGLAALQFESPVLGVEETAGVDFTGLTGGAPLETQEAYRTRVLDRIQNPVAHFNVADIDRTAREVSGVTRVFVFEITPEVGQVTVYFMRDEDDSGAIPDGLEVAEVKAALDLIRPANTAPADLIVLAPTPVPVDFSFSSVTPNTSSLKTAVEANLVQFFKESTSVGVNVLSDAYRSIIFNTVDTTNGDTVESFVLTEPSGDIEILTGEIATLGNVTI